MRSRSLALALLISACGDPAVGTDAGAPAPDAGAVTCPADPSSAAGEACDRLGATCASDACGADRCAAGCVELVCAEAPDGPRWTQAAGCTDAGAMDAGAMDAGATDAGALDAGAMDAGAMDAGPPGACAALAADTTHLLHDADTSASLGSVVWDGAGYAVVWAQLTSRDPVIFALYFGRADREGNPVPGSVRRLFEDAELQVGGALALGDGELGLAYTRGATTGLTVSNRTWFARLALDGTPLDGTGVRLSDDHWPQHGHDVAWSPTLRQWAVAWEGTDPPGGGIVSHHVYATRVDAAGAVIDATPNRLDALTSTVFHGSSALVWTGDRFAIGLAEYASVSSTRVVVVELDPATGAAARTIVVAAPTRRPSKVSLATDGATYGVVWNDIEPTSTASFRLAAVGGDPIGDAIAVGGAAGVSSPTVTTSGGTYRVAFHEGDGSTAAVWWMRIGDDGVVLDAARLVATGTPPYSSFPDMATDGCNDAIGWVGIGSLPTGGQDTEIHLDVIAGP
ncbi:MAG: hypothetical protein H6719_15020 [Sandaracinaceae bacterium]|nr:hypothetical protein [Sandaracinaceae bacterium]